MKVLVAVCLLGLVSLEVNGAPTPVAEVEIPKFVGRYYQMAHNVYSTMAGQPNTTCATIEYGVEDATTLTVDNRYRFATPTGNLVRTTGTAKTTDTPGVLEVKFDEIPTVFDYYVIKLGPVDDNNQYSYAVITDGDMNTLYVLMRDASKFVDPLKTELMTFLSDQGFTDDMKKPIETYQGSDCILPPAFDDLELVKAVDPNMMVGNHFVIYNNKNINDRVSANSKCATVQYGKVNDTTLSVANRFRVGSVDGKEDTSGTGFALTTDNPAVFVVKFNGYPMDFDYRIVKVGPSMTNAEGESVYSYLVVTDKMKNSLYVLARDVEEFMDKYNDAVLTMISEIGFDSQTSKPLLQYHDSSCKYPDGFTSGAGSLVSLGMASLLLISTLYQLF